MLFNSSSKNGKIMHNCKPTKTWQCIRNDRKEKINLRSSLDDHGNSGVAAEIPNLVKRMSHHEPLAFIEEYQEELKNYINSHLQVIIYFGAKMSADQILFVFHIKSQ